MTIFLCKFSSLVGENKQHRRLTNKTMIGKRMLCTIAIHTKQL